MFHKPYREAFAEMNAMIMVLFVWLVGWYLNVLVNN